MRKLFLLVLVIVLLVPSAVMAEEDEWSFPVISVCRAARYENLMRITVTNEAVSGGGFTTDFAFVFDGKWYGVGTLAPGQSGSVELVIEHGGIASGHMLLGGYGWFQQPGSDYIVSLSAADCPPPREDSVPHTDPLDPVFTPPGGSFPLTDDPSDHIVVPQRLNGPGWGVTSSTR